MRNLRVGRFIGLVSAVAIAAVVPCALAQAATPAAAGLTRKITFDIPAQPLPVALAAFSALTGLEFSASTDLVEGKQGREVKGELTTDEGLRTLLKGTGLDFTATTGGVVAIRAIAGATAQNGAAGSSLRLAQAQAQTPGSPSTVDTEETSGENLEEVFVRGKPFTDANVDIVRTENDVQPYYIFRGEEIAKANVINLEEFLKQRLTMNTVGATYSQVNDAGRGSSRVNLRGLGLDQTLILINGRRVAGATANFALNEQFDLNALAPAMIERIEVLPSSASAIYGGNAIGGVLNVILKRDFTGGDVQISYDTPLDVDAPIRSVTGGYGWSLDEGRTNITISASYRDSDSILFGDREGQLRRGLSRLLERTPQQFLTPNFPSYFGTTTNIASLSGQPLTFRDGTPLGSTLTYVPTGTSSATSVAELQAGLLANAGLQNTEISDTSDVRAGLNRPFSGPKQATSVAFAVRRKMSDRLELIGEMFYNLNEGHNYASHFILTPIFAGSPANPFQQDVWVKVPVRDTYTSRTRVESLRMVAGFVLDLPHDWRMQGDYTWNRSKGRLDFGVFDFGYGGPSAAADFADGTLNPFVDTLSFPLNIAPYTTSDDLARSGATSTLGDIGLRVSGPIGVLPAGQPNLTIGLGHRQERQPSGFVDYATYGLSTYLPQSQNVSSVYGEALLPLVGAANSVPGVRLLDVQAAARLEEFSVNASTQSRTAFPPDYVEDPAQALLREKVNYHATNTTLGLRYKPVEALTFRASYATAFLPPGFAQLLPGVPSLGGPVQGYFDPRRGNEAIVADLLTGGNPDLNPMGADTWALGLLFEPTVLPGARLGVEWFRTDRDDLIFSPSVNLILENEALFPDRVMRAQPAPGDPYGVGRVTLIDTSLINASHVSTEGFDFSFGYRKATERHGLFTFDLLGTVIDKFTQRISVDSPQEDIAGQYYRSGPLKLRANAALGWERGPWSLSWTTLYYGPYDQYDSPVDIAAQGATTIPHQIYHNVLAGYRFASDRGTSGAAQVLSDLTVTLGVRNVFKAVPPFDASQSLAVYSSPFGDPRLRSLQITVGKRF